MKKSVNNLAKMCMMCCCIESVSIQSVFHMHCVPVT